MPYDITQCYLPPGRGDIPAFAPAKLVLSDTWCTWQCWWSHFYCLYKEEQRVYAAANSKSSNCYKLKKTGACRCTGLGVWEVVHCVLCTRACSTLLWYPYHFSHAQGLVFALCLVFSAFSHWPTCHNIPVCNIFFPPQKKDYWKFSSHCYCQPAVRGEKHLRKRVPVY